MNPNQSCQLLLHQFHVWFAMWGKLPHHGKENCTFKGRESTTQKQFQVAELSLGQDDSWELLCLCSELCMSRLVSCKEISVVNQNQAQFQFQIERLTSVLRHVEGLPCLSMRGRRGTFGE
jgi:hypothetical protein